MLGAATLAGAHSEGKEAPSQDAVAGAMVMRLLAEMQAACLRTRGMAVAMLTSVRAWRRVAKSMLREMLGGLVMLCRLNSTSNLLNYLGGSSLLKQRKCSHDPKGKG